jgi:hypothetical protein
MIQGIRKKISYIKRAIKRRLSFIVVGSILSCLIYIIIFNDRIIEPQNVLSALGIIYNNSFNDLESDKVVSILGTLAQSNATILAIVISLSLVVIEFSASKYSARAVDVFKRDPILWGFLIVYGFSIFCPIFLTSCINENTNNSSLKFYFGTTYVLSIIAYFSLFFYILHVFKMMKPNSVIDILSKNINFQSLSEAWHHLPRLSEETTKDEPRIYRINVPLNDEKDPLLPVIDIIRASIERYDYATVRYGLNAILRCFLSNLNQNSLYEKQISEHLFGRTFEIWQLAWSKRDVNFIEMMLFFYFNIGLQSTLPSVHHLGFYPRITNSYLKRALKVLMSIYSILGIHHIEEKNAQSSLLYTIFLSEYYQKTAFKSVVKEDDFHKLSMDSIGNIHLVGSSSFITYSETKTNKQIEALESSISELSEILCEIGIEAIKADSKDAVDEVISAFNDIGEKAIIENLINSVPHLLKNLKIIGEESAKKGGEFEPLTKQIVECLENLASKIDSNSQKLSGNTQNQLVEYYEYIKSNYHTYETTKDVLEALKNREKRDISNISSYIDIISIESIKNNKRDATKQTLKSLETVERILRDGNESITICKYMRDLGLEAVKKEQTFPLMEDIIKSIYSIGMLQFGYMFDWDRDRDNWDIDRNKYQKFLEKEYSDYSARGLQSSYFDFVNGVSFEDTENFYYGAYPDDRIYGERKLIIDEKERKDIKCFNLKDINDRRPILKLFKNGAFKDSEKAYYKIPELLWDFIDPILKYTQNSPSDETRKPFDMIIQCFENFGIISIHFQDNFSLKEISEHLTSIGNYSFYNLSNSENNKSQKAWENLDCATTVVSRSIYKLAIGSLRYKVVDSSTLYQQMDCLIRIQREYHNSLFDAEYKFERILEMIKESELDKSKRDEIIKLTEDAIQELKNRKTASDGEQLDLHQKEEQSST